jgi:hypothetical protein
MRPDRAERAQPRPPLCPCPCPRRPRPATRLGGARGGGLCARGGVRARVPGTAVGVDGRKAHRRSGTAGEANATGRVDAARDGIALEGLNRRSRKIGQLETTGRYVAEEIAVMSCVEVCLHLGTRYGAGKPDRIEDQGVAAANDQQREIGAPGGCERLATSLAMGNCGAKKSLCT